MPETNTSEKAKQAYEGLFALTRTFKEALKAYILGMDTLQAEYDKARQGLGEAFMARIDELDRETFVARALED